MKRHNEEFFQAYRNLQERHAKRNRKLLDLILNAETPSDWEMLHLMVQEEFEKRKEDNEALRNHPDAPRGFRGKAADVLVYEISDQTVAYFLKRESDKARDLHDIKPLTDEESE